MAAIIDRRVCAEIEGPFVLFLIGVRINRWWKPWVWLPVVTAMPRMLTELARQPGLGLLHARSHFGMRSAMLVQYWRSHAALQAYATARDHEHLPAWTGFNRRHADAGGDIGIWHETYLIDPGRSEALYVDMPAFGLGLAGTLHDATGRRSRAMGRLDAAGTPAQP